MLDLKIGNEYDMELFKILSKSGTKYYGILNLQGCKII